MREVKPRREMPAFPPPAGLFAIAPDALRAGASRDAWAVGVCCRILWLDNGSGEAGYRRRAIRVSFTLAVFARVPEAGRIFVLGIIRP